MGMFDEKEYLTGTAGKVREGDQFFIHDAGIGGKVRNGRGEMVDEAWLRVSRTGQEEPILVYTTGIAIVGQIKRIDAKDVQRMNGQGLQVRLGVLPQADPQKNPAFILEDPTVRAADQDQDSPGQPPAEF